MSIRPASFVRSAVIALALAGALAAPAAAHEYWLEPSAYRAARNDTVSVYGWAGTGFRGERKPYPAPRTLRLTRTAAATVDLKPGATNGALTFARFVQPDDGGAIVAFHSDFTSIQLPAAEFDAYLRLEGLTGPLATRSRLGAAAGEGRERYGRCAKTWIAGADPKRATRAVGLPLEIVPLADPTLDQPLRVRVLYRGRPLRGALVRAWLQRSLGARYAPSNAATRDSVGPLCEARTNGAGVATLKRGGGGEWLVSTVHMVPSEDRAAADWQSLWASLTFVRYFHR